MMKVAKMKGGQSLCLVFGILICLIGFIGGSVRDGESEQTGAGSGKQSDEESIYYPDDVNYEYEENDEQTGNSSTNFKPITHHHHIHIHTRNQPVTTTIKPATVKSNTTTPSAAKPTTSKPTIKSSPTTTPKPSTTRPTTPPTTSSKVLMNSSNMRSETLETEEYEQEEQEEPSSQ